jgi:hypothetical protein
MKLLFSAPAAVFTMFIGLTILDSALQPGESSNNVQDPLPLNKPNPKIQAAILLDVSNSMDGLIEQAKAQLWNMVTVMGKATCDGQAPRIEIALYEYGRDNNDSKLGYIKQISPFSTDLDLLSQNLFKLTTNGGSEYCGHVIQTSLTELNWDTSSLNYKVIFISGNEDFLQGNVTYTKACEEAKKKGVIVNTIYCGDKMQGIREHWNLGAECGNGTFTNINSDAKPEEIPTPYDTTLFVLNGRLNSTYVPYGDDRAKYLAQESADMGSFGINKTVAANRVAVKGNAKLYRNSSWDLVDAITEDKKIIAKVDYKTLPDTLQKKSRKELEEFVLEKGEERGKVQNEIISVNKQRENYIAAERVRRAANHSNATTLETEVERIIREQAKRYNMVIQ